MDDPVQRSDDFVPIRTGEGTGRSRGGEEEGLGSGVKVSVEKSVKGSGTKEWYRNEYGREGKGYGKREWRVLLRMDRKFWVESWSGDDLRRNLESPSIYEKKTRRRQKNL